MPDTHSDMHSDTLAGGFADAPVDAACAFRTALDAMARPGRIHLLEGASPPAPMGLAAGVLALTLCDHETPVWLAPSLEAAAVRDWLAFHTGAPAAHDRAAAVFAFGRWDDLLPLSDFAQGTAEHPDRSATLIVETDRLVPEGVRLTGPGIDGHAALSLPDPAALRANAAQFPLGLDIFFCSGARMAALPRSTRLEG